MHKGELRMIFANRRTGFFFMIWGGWVGATPACLLQSLPHPLSQNPGKTLISEISAHRRASIRIFPKSVFFGVLEDFWKRA